MSQHPNTTPTSVDEFDNGLLSPVQTSKVAAAEKLAARDPEAVALRIKGILSRASETTDAIAVRLAKIKAAQNPLLTAAQPLVRTLASVPSLELNAETVPAFHALLVREIETFQKLCTQADLPREHVIAASYALCTALDEAANGTEWGGGKAATVAVASAANNMPTTEGNAAPSSATTAPAHANVGVWAGQMLAASFHGDTEGGIKVFQLIGRLMTHKPEGHIDLLELLHRILSLGFEGQYRSLPDGRRQHETIRQRVYAVISQARGPVPLALSPHWQGAGTGKFKLLRSVPVWVTASVLGLAAFGLFAWYKYQLVQQTDTLVTEITAIGKMTPPPVVVAPLRLAVLLKDEIAQGKVTVVEDAKHSQVVFKGDDMFIPGQAAINPKIKPLLEKVAVEIARVPGAVQVIGHSDNQPIRTPRFPNNQVLSEERATVVADALQTAGVAASRIEIRGQGDTAPIADNVTAAGRAKNRRVEIDVTAAASPVAAKSSALAPAAP